MQTIPLVKLQNSVINADVLVFDKDGTLIDLDYMWGPVLNEWITRLASSCNLDCASLAQLQQEIGLQPPDKLVPNTLMSTSTLGQIKKTLVKHIHEINPSLSLTEVTTKFETLEQFPHQYILTNLDTFLRPIGDVVKTLKNFRKHGLHIAVVTGDSYKVTCEMLKHLNVFKDVEVIICGDDPHFPAKPNPLAMDYIIQKFNTTPDRVIMVGDSQKDIDFGRNAGVGWCVRVANPNESKENTNEAADFVVSAIDEMVVIQKPADFEVNGTDELAVIQCS